MSRLLLSFVWMALVLAAFSSEPALAEKRVALVIGNSSYQNVAKLPNPVNDATSIGNMFRNVGFEVVESRFDLGSLEFKRAIREFTYQARDADIAVVYFAGHGIEVGGINYLIPVDAKLATDLDAEDEGVSLDRVIRAIEPARRLRLVILDACRDNPFGKKMQRTMAMTRAVTNGLAKIELTLSDTMIAYAAKAGSTAEDGSGANSPFTAALLKHIVEPGVDVRIAFGRVRDEVWSRTGHRQEPFVYASLGGSEVPLVPVARKIEPTTPINVENEVRRAYELTAQVGTKEAWEAFLKDYKTGLYADLARVQLAKLTTAPPPPPDTSRQAAEADRAWDKVKDTNDRAAIRKFIELFPASVHAPNAQHRLGILEKAAQEREAAAQVERETARLREEDARRAKAAEIERQQREREAAKRREEEERLATARLREEDARRAKAAEIERQQREREAAKRREEEERLAKASEAERARVEREIAKRREDEERRAREAQEQQQRLQREAALRLEQTCKRDEQTLARTQGRRAEGSRRRQSTRKGSWLRADSP